MTGLEQRFGPYGGRYVPETLIPALDELEAAWLDARDDPGFQLELSRLLRDYAGRPTPLLSARVRVAFDEPVRAAEPRPYAMRGAAENVAAEIAKFAELGVEHLALFFEVETAVALVAAAERFDAEVRQASRPA